jgi:hypothetical protein
MANSVVASWTVCIKELQRLMDAADATDPPAAEVEAFTKRIDKLQKQPPMPHAAWKKLVQDAKVMHAGADGGGREVDAPKAYHPATAHVHTYPHMADGTTDGQAVTYHMG